MALCIPQVFCGVNLQFQNFTQLAITLYCKFDINHVKFVYECVHSSICIDFTVPSSKSDNPLVVSYCILITEVYLRGPLHTY